MNTFKEMYTKTIAPELMKTFGYANIHEVPKLEKVVVNVGAGRAVTDGAVLDTIDSTLTRITGQHPVRTRAKRSISNFKIRQGMPIGVMVTLRGEKMYDFFQKIVQVTLPRVRDFRGIPAKNVDTHGNLTFGLREHTVFPEIKSDEIDRLHGIEITAVTSAKTAQEAHALFTGFGFPFQHEETKA